MAQIELRAVNKAWGAFVGVRHLDLEIHDQEFLVLLGPSGCGKTTTMRMIAGLEDLTSGEILIDGELVNDVEARDRDVAMVFQSYALYPNMSVYENIRFPLRMRGVPKAQHRRPGGKSGRQRWSSSATTSTRKPAAPCRAGSASAPRSPGRWCASRSLFLMDEPLSNLDAKLRSSMRVQLKHVQRQLKITTIYVTHDQIEAMTLADRIVVMSKGLIQQVGTPDEIYGDPANTFVAGFIGSPPMNLVAGEVVSGAFLADGVRVEGVPVADGPSITLGVRPEDGRLVAAGEGQLKGAIYGLEPMGDVTYLSIKTRSNMFEVKVDRDFRAALDTQAEIVFDKKRLYFFDSATGRRIRTDTLAQPRDRMAS